MDGFARRTERKKRAIIDAASQLLAEKGYNQLKIEEIAKKAKVSQVTIYNYFGSKKKLIHQVVKEHIMEQNDNYERLMREEKPFPEIFRSTILKKKNHSHILILEELAEIFEEDAELKQFIEDYYKNKFIPLFLQFIRKGKEEGYIRKEISDEAILLYIDAVTMMIDHNLKESSFKDKMEELGDQLFDMFFYGLLNEGKRV